MGIIQLHVMETDLTLLASMPAVEQYSSEGGGQTEAAVQGALHVVHSKSCLRKISFYLFFLPACTQKAVLCACAAAPSYEGACEGTV